jgi:hypothetical protein
VAGFKRDRQIERRLRASRPQPSARLMQSLAPRRTPRRQIALAGALTAALLVALSAVGGVSYAANAVNHAVTAAKQTVAPTKAHNADATRSLSSGGDQYRPGFGFGDRNHNHTGPPGLKVGRPGEKTPPTQVRRLGNFTIVSNVITLDEQAALYFSVIGPDGKKVLLLQNGSRIGSGVQGKPTKTIHYVMLVPRALRFSLKISNGQLQQGKTYKIQIIAVDSDGNKSKVEMPFVA